jgi:hypothetical protein
MGTSGLSGTTPTRGERARRMEHQQIGAWPVAPVEDPGARTGVAGAALQHNGSAVLGRAVGSLHRTAGYVIRLYGGVGVAPCKRMEFSRLKWRSRQSLASSRVPSLA